jgi:hypothetical protein
MAERPFQKFGSACSFLQRAGSVEVLVEVSSYTLRAFCYLFIHLFKNQ